MGIDPKIVSVQNNLKVADSLLPPQRSSPMQKGGARAAPPFIDHRPRFAGSRPAGARMHRQQMYWPHIISTYR